MDTVLIIVAATLVLLAVVAVPQFLASRKRALDEAASWPAARPRVVTPEAVDADPCLRWLVDEACRQTGADLRKDPVALARLAEAADEARTRLQFATEHEISLPYLGADVGGPRHFQFKATRAAMERARAGIA